ncbi:hypothetical protein NEOLEDRAFT_1234482 [Neolentinus lepideus HHB14362 ss-1]|uniref:Uncharacterized protein n=1 Tax=Neolentinus lepideus HHB14362 ss-1 TaxID=1314782 RepID=A0A165NB01_9AGAM|nr:hypothetical protein NEOLEDRAFT_1234482 [Neolentinus lepideus HHB14362 ss-1]
MSLECYIAISPTANRHTVSHLVTFQLCSIFSLPSLFHCHLSASCFASWFLFIFFIYIAFVVCGLGPILPFTPSKLSITLRLPGPHSHLTPRALVFALWLCLPFRSHFQWVSSCVHVHHRIIPPLIPSPEPRSPESPEAKWLLQSIHSSVADARDNLLATKVDQAFYVNRSCGPEHSFQIGDYVMLSTRNQQ